MFNLSSQSQSNEGQKKTFDSKFQIPKLSARSSGHSSHVTNFSDDGGKKDALHSSSSAPPSTTTMAAYQNATGGQPNEASGNMSSMNLSSSGGSGGSGVAEGASKMLTDFFAMSNLTKMAGTSNAPSKYPVSDIHFNKNLQIYKSLSSDSLPRGSSLSASDLRDQHLSMSNPATSVAGAHRSMANNTSSGLLHQFPYPMVDKTTDHKTTHNHPPQSISPMNISTNHQVAFNSAPATSSANHSMRPPSTPSPTSAAATLSNPDVASFKTSGLDGGALDYSGHLHPKLENQHNNYKLFESRHHSTSIPSSASIPLLSSHTNPRTTNSPSVQVHIVKSPVPSPLLVIPSPRSSSSPCITDDELMDEALIGIGSK